MYVSALVLSIIACENYLFHHNVHLQIPVKAPESARGELEITYVDEELR